MSAAVPARAHTRRGIARALATIEDQHRYDHHDDHYDAFCSLCVEQAYRLCGYGDDFR